MSFMRNNNNNRNSSSSSSSSSSAASSSSADGSSERSDTRIKPPKAIDIRTLLVNEEGLVVKGLPKNKTLNDTEVKLPILWKVHNEITNQDKIQTTNFLIGNTTLKVANQVSKKPGPFSSKDSRGKITIPQPNKYSMLIRIGDEEMIESFHRLDETIKSKIRDGNLLADYRVTADKIDDCYKPFLIENGSGDFSISTSFNVNADGTLDPSTEVVDVKLMIVSRNVETGEIENSFKPASVEDIRIGDSVIIEGGFDAIRLDKMSQTPDGVPRIGFKHYARRIIVVRTLEDMQEEDDDDDDSFLLAAVSGKTFTKAPASTTTSTTSTTSTTANVGDKRARSPEPVDSNASGGASSSPFFKRN